MEAALAQSLAAALAAHAPASGPRAGPPTPASKDARSGALASDFTAYFDLIALDGDSSGRVGEADAHAVVARARSSLRSPDSLAGAPDAAAPLPGRPCIVTLDEAHFSREERAALSRWWDMEPDNALHLAAVTPAELAAARQLIGRAMDELQQAAPDLYAEVLIITREIVVAQPGQSRRLDFGAVSSFAAWGAIGINHRAHSHWADCLRTVVHESAHLLLFAIARDQPLVYNDATERQSSPLRDDARPVDGIFHAAFVSAREALALDACLQRLEAAPATADPALAGYLEQLRSLSVLAFVECDAQLREHAQLSPLGKEILSETRSYIESHFEILS